MVWLVRSALLLSALTFLVVTAGVAPEHELRRERRSPSDESKAANVMNYIVKGTTALGAALAGYWIYTGKASSIISSEFQSRALNDVTTDEAFYSETGLLKMILTLGILEDFYRKYDMWNPDCHHKSLCELHKRVPQLATFTRVSRSMFDWPMFRNFIGLPRVFPRALTQSLDNLVQACYRGADQEDCGSYYPNCRVSLGTIFEGTKQNSINDL